MSRIVKFLIKRPKDKIQKLYDFLDNEVFDQKKFKDLLTKAEKEFKEETW